MLNITGTYDFHGPDFVGLTIRGVAGVLPVNTLVGALLDSFLRDSNSDTTRITGRYDAVTNMITFSSALFPGEILSTIFFTGFAIPNPNSLGEVNALAGTWHRQTLKFDTSRKVIDLVSEQGSWFADNHQLEVM